MRNVARWLFIVFVFTIPWEFSLDLGEPLGNVARILGLLLFVVMSFAVLQARKIRTPGPMQWLVLALFLWFCCTCFWSISIGDSIVKIRAYFQEMVIVWVAWEVIEQPKDLHMALRAFVGGSHVLAILTIVGFAAAGGAEATQGRFTAIGQDPNDVARFLDVGFPLAAFLVDSESNRIWKIIILGYIPLGFVALLLTASRSGFLAALIALLGSAFLLIRHKWVIISGGFLSPLVLVSLWLFVPHNVFSRLATIPAQLQHGDLNQRLNIWNVGWHAFLRAPIAGSGAGTFVQSSRLSPINTAHNSLLSYAVSGGVCALLLAVVIMLLALWYVLHTQSTLRIGLLIAFIVLSVTALVATVEENRTTWFLLAVFSIAGRMTIQNKQIIKQHFPRARHIVAAESV